MRVLHVAPYFAPAYVYGGPPRSILGLCRALISAGVEVEVLTTNANGDADLPANTAARDHFEEVPVRYCERSFPRRNFASREMKQILKTKSDYDVMHIHGCWNFASWAGAAACRARGRPLIVSPRGMLTPWSFRHGSLKKTAAFYGIERPYLRKAAAIHVTTEAERQSVEQLDLKGCAVIPNGIDFSEFSALPPRAEFRQTHGIGDGDFVVLFLGRIHPVKGLETLCSAFEQVARSCPGARLIIAGDGEAQYAASLKQRYDALVKDRRCIFAGDVSGRARLAAYSCADVFALTSHSENFGLVVAEAFAAGLPAVLSLECPWPEAETWGAGFRVKNDPNEVASALLKLCNDPQLQKKMGDAAFAKVRENMSWERVGAQMKELYSRVLSSAAH